MANITKHHNDFTNGKCANNENVSANGKRCELRSSTSCFDWAEKEAINQQRKLRLVQVN